MRSAVTPAGPDRSTEGGWGAVTKLTGLTWEPYTGGSNEFRLTRFGVATVGRVRFMRDDESRVAVLINEGRILALGRLARQRGSAVLPRPPLAGLCQ